MKASVMIPTFCEGEAGLERLANLKSVVRALGDQTETDFELVVVVDGPEGNRAVKYLKDVKRRAPFPITTISRPREGIRIASARNLLLGVAQAPVLIGIQDNVLPSPGFIAAHLALHEEHQPPIFVIGLACSDPADLNTDHRHQRGYCVGKEWFDGWGRNFSVTADVAKITRYDETYDGQWGHEDVDFAYCLWLAGVKFYYAEGEATAQYLNNAAQPRTQDSLARQSDIFFANHGIRI